MTAKIIQFANHAKSKNLVVQSPDAVEVEDIDRATKEVLGDAMFVTMVSNRVGRHTASLKMADEVGLVSPAVALLRKAKEQLDLWGTYERPIHGLQLKDRRATMEFVYFERNFGEAAYIYKCIEPSKTWAKGQLVAYDFQGRCLGPARPAPQV